MWNCSAFYVLLCLLSYWNSPFQIHLNNITMIMEIFLKYYMLPWFKNEIENCSCLWLLDILALCVVLPSFSAQLWAASPMVLSCLFQLLVHWLLAGLVLPGTGVGMGGTEWWRERLSQLCFLLPASSGSVLGIALLVSETVHPHG